MERYTEAAERGWSLLRRIDLSDSAGNGNLPWVLNVLVEALLRLERDAEAQALVPRSIAVGKRFGTTVARQGILGLVAAQGRMGAAARLLGYTQRLWSAHGATPDRDEQGRMVQVRALVEARLGSELATSRLNRLLHAEPCTAHRRRGDTGVPLLALDKDRPTSSSRLVACSSFWRLKTHGHIARARLGPDEALTQGQRIPSASTQPPVPSMP
jgi:hypothetical protein